VLSFNLFLTGYDVQAINLYDVIVRGTIAPPNGTTPATTPGALSAVGGNLRPTPTAPAIRRCCRQVFSRQYATR
jgi:hypothetical protein